jgi:hypothetical protein
VLAAPIFPNLKVWAMENLNIPGLTWRLWGVAPGYVATAFQPFRLITVFFMDLIYHSLFFSVWI